MAGPPLTQGQMQSLPDILSNDRFVVNFGSVPNYGDTYNSLTFKAMDVYIPGINNERFEVPLGPVYRSFRGKRNYPRTMTLQFTESVDLSTLTSLRNWLEFVVGTQSGNSQGYISSYAVTCNIITYDTTGNPVDVIFLVNCFPIGIQDTQFSTQQTSYVQVAAEFSYDYPTFQSTQQL